MFRNTCAIFLILMAFTRPLGYLLHNPTLMLFGIAYGVSPQPMPFTERNGFENYSMHQEITLEYKNGEKEYIDVDRKIISNIPGPHRYKVVPFMIIAWGPTYPREILNPVYERFFCKPGILTDKDAIQKVTTTYISNRTNEQLSTVAYACAF